MQTGAFILKGIPEDLASLRGSLRHSWLENLIEAREPEDVAELHACEKSVRRPFDDDITSGGGFDRRLDEVRELARQMVEGFSPARVVDSGPLARLPEDVKCSMKDVLHKLYLSESGIRGIAAELMEAREAFGAELRRFRGIWECAPVAAPGEVAAGFRRLKDRGRVLHEVLGRVPEGVVLP